LSDIKIFRLSGETVVELEGYSVTIEKSIQVLIEKHLETFLGVRFLASEYSTGKTHAGRIDTLGLDENGCPVIIEYKRAVNENVINQGLFYLDWLMDHKAEFILRAIDRFGKEVADAIEWSTPACSVLRGASLNMIFTRCSRSTATLSLSVIVTMELTSFCSIW